MVRQCCDLVGSPVRDVVAHAHTSIRTQHNTAVVGACDDGGTRRRCFAIAGHWFALSKRAHCSVLNLLQTNLVQSLTLRSFICELQLVGLNPLARDCSHTSSHLKVGPHATSWHIAQLQQCMPFFTSFSACSCKGAGRQATTVATRGCQQQQQHAQLLRHITAEPATRSRHHGTVKPCASTLNTGISKGVSSGRSQTATAHAATAPSPDSYSAAQESTAQQNSSKARADSNSSATLPLTPRDARFFFVRLATYRPQQLVERRWQLPQACPYSPDLFQQAADAAAAQPRAVLGGLSDQQLAYVAAAYAAAQHPHAGKSWACTQCWAQCSRP